VAVCSVIEAVLHLKLETAPVRRANTVSTIAGPALRRRKARRRQKICRRLVS
jgi:hypothetical protein